MPDSRVGTLDHPQRYGVRSVSVYSNSKGYYLKITGSREAIHGNQLWTTLEDVKMRGSAPVGASPSPWIASQDDDEEERNLAVAIQASLDHRAIAPAPESQEDTAAAPASSGGNYCTICLTEPSNMLMRPCNHLIACERCAQRLVRQPCPVCRRNVRSTERVFF